MPSEASVIRITSLSAGVLRADAVLCRTDLIPDQIRFEFLHRLKNVSSANGSPSDHTHTHTHTTDIPPTRTQT